MKQISTATLGGRKRVEIDGHGYTVRKIGAGEALALNQAQRRMDELNKKEKAKTITDEEMDEQLRLLNKFIDAMTALYDDGEGGKKSKTLIASLSPDEMTAMQNAIWEDEKVENEATKANA